MSDSLKPLSDCLGARITELESRALAVDALTAQVRSALPRDLSPHVITAVVRETTLVIVADSSAWCAQIRYAEEQLRRHLDANGGPVFARLRVRVGQSPSPG
jgi:hypothetical protein